MGSEAVVCSVDGYSQYHVVAPGETLWGVTQGYYGTGSAHGTQAAIQHVLSWNPQIQDPAMIHPGDLIHIRTPLVSVGLPAHLDAGASSVVLHQTREIMTAWDGIPRGERQAIASMGPVLELAGLGLVGAGGGLTSFELLVKTNAPTLQAIVEKYEDYRAGRVTRGQYDYFRRKSLAEFRRRFGQATKLLFGRRSANVVLRMKPGGGAAATGPMLAEIKRLRGLGRAVSRGGVVLSVVGLGVACAQIAQTTDVHEKNVIAVEAISGAAIGSGAGVVAGLFLAATPVGWGVALVVGLGSAAAGYFGGELAGYVYRATGEPVKVVSALGIDRVCR